MNYLKVRSAAGDMDFSKLVLGSANFGLNISRDEAYAIMDKYYELGGNVIDSARSYGGEADPTKFGLSEGIVASWIRDRGNHDKVYFITKGGFPELGENFKIIRSRINEKELREDFQRTWENCGLDHIDVYMLHRDDLYVPVSDIMDLLHEFVAEGKVRALGASNWSLERIRKANAYAIANGKTPFTLSEIQWSYPDVDPNDDTCVYMRPNIHKAYAEDGVPIVSFTSQARGFFIQLYNGSLSWDELPPFMKGMDNAVNRRKYAKLKEFCDTRKVSPAAVCTAYIACNEVPGAPIIGSWSVSEVEDSMKGAELRLTQEEIRWLDDVYN